MYPTVDLDTSSYSAGIVYIDGASQISFPGAHQDFGAAKTRAERIRSALVAAGEIGIKAHVGFRGERPVGFPRNGVTL